MFMEYSCIVLCALLSISVSYTRSPFMALMFAVMLLINASIVLLMLGFEFLALVNIVVYVGALAVLFVFVVMLLEIPSSELLSYNRGWSVCALVGALACRLFHFGHTFDFSAETKGAHSQIPPLATNYNFVPSLESISSVGHAFYIHYADLLILNSLVLTIALFGALVLAHTRS